MKAFSAWLMRTDHSLINVVNRRWKCGFFDWLMPMATYFGGATVTLIFLVFWWLVHDMGEKIWAIEGLIALAGSHLVVWLLKKFMPRFRPYIKLSNLYTYPNPLTDYSFPSGHTTAAFSIAVTFCLHDSDFISIFIPIAILVGLSRMYLALHYPTDVICGVLIGSGFAWGTVHLFSLYFAI